MLWTLVRRPGQVALAVTRSIYGNTIVKSAIAIFLEMHRAA